MAYIKKRKKYLFYTMISFVSLLIVGFAAYLIYDPIKEEVDELYYSTYFNLFIDPTMKAVADKKANIAYCNSSSQQQKLDVYTPKNIENALPVVVYIHGGGWSGGNKATGFVADYGAEIVKRGLVFVSINYRLAPTYTYPAQNQDVDCALKYLTNHAVELHIDTKKVGLFGDSAGGQLAAMAALTSPYKSSIKAVVEFYGPSDVWQQVTRKPHADKWAINYIGSTTDEARARQASPLYANMADAPPFLLFHGTNDQTVHYDQSVNFTKKLKQAGVDATLVPVARANHDINSHSSPTRNEVEAQTVQFFKKHLLP